MTAIKIFAKVVNFLTPSGWVTVGESDGINECHGLRSGKTKQSITTAAHRCETFIAATIGLTRFDEIIDDVGEVEEVE